MKVYNYCKNNKDKITLATGDINQLECISEVSNVKDYESYINHCINLFLYVGYPEESGERERATSSIGRSHA